MRWGLVWVGMGLVTGCRGCGGPPSGDTGTDTDTPDETGTEDTGEPLPPCPWAGAWVQLSHDCAASEAISWAVALEEDCVLVLTAERYGDDGTPYPPLCSTTEQIALSYDEPSATWRAVSETQSQTLEDCYRGPVGAYPLGVVEVVLGDSSLSLTFEPAPWSLSECAAAEVLLTP